MAHPHDYSIAGTVRENSSGSAAERAVRLAMKSPNAADEFTLADDPSRHSETAFDGLHAEVGEESELQISWDNQAP